MNTKKNFTVFVLSNWNFFLLRLKRLFTQIFLTVLIAFVFCILLYIFYIRACPLRLRWQSAMIFSACFFVFSKCVQGVCRIHRSIQRLHIYPKTTGWTAILDFPRPRHIGQEKRMSGPAPTHRPKWRHLGWWNDVIWAHEMSFSTGLHNCLYLDGIIYCSGACLE